LLAVGITTLAVIAYRRKWYILCGSIVFYTVNIALLLQFIQFGETLMADRYLYIACIGILFPVVYYLFSWCSKMGKDVIAIVVGAGIAGVLLLMTFLRNDIWLSDFNFYTSIAETFPESPVAHYSLGALYMRQGKYPEAEQHMDLAVALDPGNYKAWYNKGSLYLREGKPMESLDALNKCLVLNEYTKAYFSRAMLYQGTGKPQLAIADADKVLKDQPQNARAYYIKADSYEQLGELERALENYNSAIQYDDKEPLFFIRRGLANGKANRGSLALADLNTAVTLNKDNSEAFYYRGMIKVKVGQSGCDDFRTALRLGYRQAQAAIDKFCAPAK
jgi:tetratricopeptide (TPR) repeat protein